MQILIIGCPFNKRRIDWFGGILRSESVNTLTCKYTNRNILHLAILPNYISHTTKIPFQEAIELTRTAATGETLLCRDTHFILNSRIYKQHDGVVVGFLLNSMLGNIFLCQYEQI